MSKSTYLLLAALLLLISQSCTQHKVEVAPVEVKPIHITIDVNVKVDKALDEFAATAPAGPFLSVSTWTGL